MVRLCDENVTGISAFLVDPSCGDNCPKKAISVAVAAGPVARMKRSEIREAARLFPDAGPVPGRCEAPIRGLHSG